MAKLVIEFLIIIFINLFLIKFFGQKYLTRLNTFISENSNIIVKNEINNIIKNNNVINESDIYNILYNDKKEIINVDLNTNVVNILLSRYAKKISDALNNNQNNYLNKYYKTFTTKKHQYYLLPLGMMSSNPFLYEAGPNIILNYECINTPLLKIKVNLKNYGLNNALIETYLVVHIDQSILRPILKKVSTFDYSFLISSKIINGRVSNFLGTNFNVESESISNT